MNEPKVEFPAGKLSLSFFVAAVGIAGACLSQLRLAVVLSWQNREPLVESFGVLRKG